MDGNIVGRFVRFAYTNHRGITEERRVRVSGLRYGNSEYYPQSGWLLQGYCTDRKGDREFSFDNIMKGTLIPEAGGMAG